MADKNPNLTRLIIAEREAGLTMAAISEKMNSLGYRTSKNSVIGVIARHAPELQNADLSRLRPRTLWDRLQTLHDKLDAVLAECRNVPRLAASHEP